MKKKNEGCEFLLKDKVRVVINKKPLIYSACIYTIDDIQTIHSMKTDKTEYRIILLDDKKRMIAPRGPSDLKLSERKEKKK